MTDNKKKWVDSRETHVGKGSYQQIYYTDVKGIKGDPAPLQPKPLNTNPNAKFYFYVTTESYPNLTFLADELYGPASQEQSPSEPWSFFTNFNIQIFGMKPIKPGTWLFIPEIKLQYGIGDYHNMYIFIQNVQTQQSTLSDTALALYGKGLKILGYAYFSLTKAAEGVSKGLELINDHLDKVKEAVQNLAYLGLKAKEVAKTGDAASNEALKLEIKASTDELSEKMQTFLKKVGTPTDEEMKTIRLNTSVEWQKNLFSLKAFDLKDTEINALNKIIVKGSKISGYSNKLGKTVLVLSGIERAYDVFEACKVNPESPLCAQAAVENSAGFVGNLGGGVLGSNAVDSLFEKILVPMPSEDLAAGAEAGGKVSLGEALGCNVALDAETVGLGFFACTATIWVGSGTVSYYLGNLASNLSLKFYERTFDFPLE